MRSIKGTGAIAILSFLLVVIAQQVHAVPLDSTQVFDGLNIKNLFAYTPLQHDIVSHVLTLGFAAQAAGLVYFLATLSNIAPRYRLSSVLSAVVMASATLQLFQLSQNWNEAFVFTDGIWQLGDTSFSNGFRYMNWSIDVPMLLLQLVVVLGLTRSQAISYGTKFIIGGLLMIWTGYIGQFYEVTSLTQLLIWGAPSAPYFMYMS